MTWLMIGIGGAAGAWLRFEVGTALGKRFSHPVPWPTWIINVVGSFLLGILTVFAPILPKYAIELLAVGFCGAFTTFSTFGVEALQLWNDRRYKLFWMYILLTAIMAVAASAAGYVIGHLYL